MSLANEVKAVSANNSKLSSSQPQPPGPSGRWGGVNHLLAIRADFRVFSHDLHRKYGDVLFYRVGKSIYQFATPELAHEVLVVNAKSLHKPQNQKRAFGRIIGSNLFTSDGEPWMARRQLMAPLFLPQVIDRYRAIVMRQTASRFEQFNDGAVDISRAANCIAVLSVAEALFGAGISNVVDEFLDVAGQLQGAVTRQILSPFLLPTWIPTRDNRTVRSALKFFHGLVSSLIAERRRSPDKHSDLLTALLSATDAESGTRLTDQEAIDEAITLLLAGSDTTAAALSWSAFLLAKHPEYQDQLRAEVQQITGSGPLKVEHAPGLRFAEQVFQEALRLYPPATSIARQAAEPVEIGGVSIPRGALVFVSVYSIHHDARWFPDPERFQPERFSPTGTTEVPEHAFLPFGLGPRACIGRRFSMMEGTLVLAEMVRQFEIQLTSPSQEPQLETQLSLHPRGGMRLNVKRLNCSS